MDHALLHHDRWGEIIDGGNEGYCEIRWFDTTASMDGAAFNTFLSTFAGCVERTGHRTCLVDATAFRMDVSRMDMGWRDANIIPRYNAAGVTRFAFHVPAGMPAIGTAPAVEGPAAFPTGYFETRDAALQWLVEGAARG